MANFIFVKGKTLFRMAPDFIFFARRTKECVCVLISFPTGANVTCDVCLFFCLTRKCVNAQFFKDLTLQIESLRYDFVDPSRGMVDQSPYRVT